MRIIRGKFRSKKISPPKNFSARPTTDFAKEGLFNILENRFDFEEIKLLDLFSGTGSISYEFLSRGGSSATAVESDKRCVLFIERNTREMFKNGELKVIQANAYSMMSKLNLDFDIIFADPPYSDEKVKDIPEIIFSNSTIKPKTLLIIEHSATVSFSENAYLEEHRKYGSVNFSFFSKNNKKVQF